MGSFVPWNDAHRKIGGVEGRHAKCKVPNARTRHRLSFHSAFRNLYSPLKVSVIGLAPIRPDLKGRLRELLCIHRQKWSPLVSRQRLLVFSEALICLSYSGFVEWLNR